MGREGTGGRRSVGGLGDVPVPARWMLLGAVGLGVIGGVVGPVLGLDAYPPTAWFAVLEVGIPATILGGLLGLAAGGAAWGIGRLRTQHHHP